MTSEKGFFTRIYKLRRSTMLVRAMGQPTGFPDYLISFPATLVKYTLGHWKNYAIQKCQ